MSRKLWITTLGMLLLQTGAQADDATAVGQGDGTIRESTERAPSTMMAPIVGSTVNGEGTVAADPLRASPLTSYDNAGGDDKLVLADPVIVQSHGYSMDIAENGDVFVAVERVDPAEGSEILVYRSTDGGDVWALWGSRSDADPTRDYHQPSLHIAEGDQNRLYLAYQYENGAADRVINVAYSSLNLDSAVWTVRAAMSQAAVSFQNPNLSSDEMNFNAYRLYLVAEGDDGNGNDIWFSRSIDYGDSWEAEYAIASLASSDRDYRWPEIRYGSGGIVHCVWQFRIFGNEDTAVRYRRAINYAGAPADWRPVVSVTSVTDGRHDECPSVAASHVGNAVLISYLDYPGSVSESQIRLSTDAGATWPSGSTLDLPVGGSGPELLALPAGQGFRIAGYHWDGDAGSRIGLYTSSDAAPLTLSSEMIFTDQWGVGGGDPTVAIDYDASRSDRLGFIWLIWDYFNSEQVYFDAEWRRDPGYPNLEDNFPHALSAGAVAHPALVNLDDDANLEILFGDASGFIQAFNSDASIVAGWPVDIGDFPPTYPAPGGYPTANCAVAVDDLDGDGRPEVVAGSTDGQVCVYRIDGTPMPGWPLNLGAGLDVFVSLGSIVGGSRRQIVACAGSQVHVLHPNGFEALGFPVAVPSALTAPAAIGDVNDDNRNDLVVTGGDRLTWFDNTGHFQLAYILPAGRVFCGQASLGDLDLNGDLEIVAPTSQGYLVSLHHNGDNVFPIVSDPSQSYLTSVALANVIGSFEPDLSFAARSWTAHLLLSTGTEATGWPHGTTAGYFLLGPPIMDTLDEGSGDVVIGSRDGLGYAWENLFSHVPGWPKDLAGACNVSPASGDIDLDGKLEVVFATSTHLIVLDTGALVDHTDPRGQWPMYGCNPARTACLDCPEDLASAVADASGAGRSGLRIVSENPSGGSVRLRFAPKTATPVQIDVYDAAGRRIRNLLRDEVRPGVRDVLWDGRDGDGRAVPAGAYFCRLRCGEDLSTARVFLVR